MQSLDIWGQLRSKITMFAKALPTINFHKKIIKHMINIKKYFTTSFYEIPSPKDGIPYFGGWARTDRCFFR
jgi:hypothetical protein